MNKAEIIGLNIKRLRKQKGITKKYIAEKLKLHWDTINKWEKGKSAPSLDNLIAIAEILGVTVDDLLSPPEPEPFPGFHDVMALPVKERYFKVFELAANHCGFEGAIVHALGDPVFKDEVPMLETDEDVIKAYNEYKAFWEEKARQLLSTPGIDEERRKAAKEYLEKKFGMKIELDKDKQDGR